MRVGTWRCGHRAIHFCQALSPGTLCTHRSASSLWRSPSASRAASGRAQQCLQPVRLARGQEAAVAPVALEELQALGLQAVGRSGGKLRSRGQGVSTMHDDRRGCRDLPIR